MGEAGHRRDRQSRKPRLAIMGEFSSGKSTLARLLLGDAPLPVRVTATSLPPVRISQGTARALAVGHDGTETPLDIADLGQVRVERTRLLRLWVPSDTLALCDLIDMPGFSDPNLAPDSCMPLIDEVDSVVWCTQATQAWRQSEAAAWAAIAGRTNGDNLLLVTQADKLRSERDLDRVLRRVRKETAGLFRAVYPVSILEALGAGEDHAAWVRSGAAAFVDHLVDLLLAPSPSPEPGPAAGEEETAPSDAVVLPMAAPAASGGDAVPRVQPRRVRVRTEMRGRVARPGPPLTPGCGGPS